MKKDQKYFEEVRKENYKNKMWKLLYTRLVFAVLYRAKCNDTKNAISRSNKQDTKILEHTYYDSIYILRIWTQDHMEM